MSRPAVVAGRPPRARLAPCLLIAALAGGAQALALAPVPNAALALLAALLLPALIIAQRGGPARAALIAWVYGLAWLSGSFWWLFISMHRYGQLPAPLAGAAVLALAAALALIPALAAALWQRGRTGRVLPDALGWAALWLGVELARGRWFSGFPWGASGYAHADGLLAALAPWVGVHGIGAVAAGLAAAFAGAASRVLGQARERSAAALLTLWIAGAALAAAAFAPAWRGPDFTTPTGRLGVALLQGNVPQDQKFDWSRLPEALAWHLRTVVEAEADLVVAPETAIPLLPEQLPEGLWPRFTGQIAATPGRHVLIGLPLGDFERGYTNSVAGLGPTGTPPYRYDKHHLVPFGEFVPPGFRWFVDAMHIPLGDFARGPLVAPSFGVRGERVAPNICYEDLFGEELAARFVDADAAPTILANVSNIGWFGETVAVDQHLQISRLRSLELQRPMLRATNTGATVIIDHRGRVTHQLAPHRRGVLQGEVQGRSGVTPYAWWVSRVGLWPLWALVLAGVLASVRARPAGRGAPGSAGRPAKPA